jgi:hypothetical protein
MTSAILGEIAQAIGLPATIELTRAYGGRTLHVPKAMPSLHPLVLAIGAGAATVMSREFAGMALEIPAERTALIAQRNEAIILAYGQGMSVKGLAVDHGLSRKMIRKILRRAGVPLRSEGTGPTS